jgi:hypothetical protein
MERTMSNSRDRWLENHLKKVKRRWFLGGGGALLALPYLEFFQEKQAYAAGPKRLFLFHMPAGCNMTAWKPSGTGTGFTLGPTMKPVDDAGLKPKVAVVTGTNAIGGPRGHTCGISGVLTGVQCGSSANNSISWDQVVAQAWAGQTPLTSLELGTAHNTENPNAESGYSTVLKDNLNWSSSTVPLSREIDPAKAFTRAFGGLDTTGGGMGTGGGTSGTPDPTPTLRKSVLDLVLAQSNDLKMKLGASDKEKLDQYLTGLSQIERTIQTMPGTGQTDPVAASCSPGTSPSQTNDLPARVKVMLDIMIHAFMCDVTRVGTFAYEHTTTEIRHTWLGVNVGYHSNVTHHNNDGTALANYATVNQWLVSQFVYVLQALDKVQDGDGTMLDNMVCMCFSELSDGNSHSNQDMPVLLAGSAGGALQTGRAIAGSGSIEGIYVALMQALGVNQASFARAKSPLNGLLA